MEVLTSIAAAVVAKTGQVLCRSVYSKIKYVVRFKSSLNDLEKEMKNLMDLQNDVEIQLDSAMKEERSPKTEVKRWLRDVEEFVTRVNLLVQEGIVADDKRLRGCLCQCRLRTRLSKEAEELLKEVERLMKAGSFPDGVAYVKHSEKPVEKTPEPVEHVPGTSIKDQTAASRTLAELVKTLDEDKFQRIGVSGMGGVGKTTLVKNLNNRLKSICLKQPFSIVLWVTVSKEVDVKRIQKQIAERLSLKMEMEDSIERTSSLLYERLLQEKKFLLILDDVWEHIDLDCVGIPQPETHSGSRILLTSRFSDVCRMMTDFEIKLPTLSDEEAWELFSQKAGEVASLEDIKPFAKAVARECCGLPLALITVGTAMRGKAKVELWKHALRELQRSEPRMRGMKDKVYNPLKWSYDSLEGHNIKACFLFCALYPEDYSIEVNELVRCCLGEGMIDERQNFEEAVNSGIAMVETLKDSCLLEDGAREGSVKMHDVVRDVAIWIASSLENDHESLSRSGIGLSEIPVAELSSSLKRVSFVNNKIVNLPDCGTQCSNVSTLLLQENMQLKEVSERFLQGFKALRVLNIGRTRIRSLPALQCDLRVLLLAGCSTLEEVSAVAALSNLQVLDLSGTRIRELAKDMEYLVNLRQVNLSDTFHLKTIQAGIISKWTCLEVLEMSSSSFYWGMKEEVEEGQAYLQELGCLKQLYSISIILGSISFLGSEVITKMDQVTKFDFFVGPNHARNSIPSIYDGRRVTISGPYVRSPYVRGSVRWSLVNPNSLFLNSCGTKLNGLLQDFVTPGVVGASHRYNVGIFGGLKSLYIRNGCLKQGDEVASYDPMPHLKELRLEDVSGLESISQSFGHLGLKFSNLKLIEVSQCPQIKYLFAYGDSIVNLPNVETIKVRWCDNLATLFHFSSEDTSRVDPFCPKLRRLELQELPKLGNLCRADESWPSLEQVGVVACYQLTKLPLTLQNADTIKEIRGESQFWRTLEWDNESTKSTLQQYFIPCSVQSLPTESITDYPPWYIRDGDTSV